MLEMCYIDETIGQTLWRTKSNVTNTRSNSVGATWLLGTEMLICLPESALFSFDKGRVTGGPKLGKIQSNVRCISAC